MRWGVGDFFWVLGAQVAGSFAGGGVAVIVDQFVDLSLDEALFLVVVPFQSIAMGAALLVVSRRLGRGTLRADFGFEVSVRDWTAAFVGLGWRVVIVVVMLPLFTLLDADEPTQQVVQELDDASRTVQLASIFWVVVAAPVIEEIWFRGLLLRALLRRSTPAVAVVVSGTAFGFIHMLDAGFGAEGLVTAVGLTALGLFLGAQAIRHGSLSRPIITHASFNLFGMLVLIVGM